jgi:titin
LSTASGTDFDLTNISTLTSITQTSSTVCTIAAVSNAIANGSAVVSTLTKAASFSITDTAGNAQTTLAGSPQSVTVTRNGEPDAPVISSVTAGNAQVVVALSAPANNGAAITDYVVQYSTSSGGSYTTFADSTSTSTSATVTGLTNGTAYYFKVAATNSVGTGSYSDASTSVIPVSAPGAPTMVAGTAGNTTVALTWVVPTSTGGSAITEYVVQYSTTSDGSYTTFDDGLSTSTSATVTGLTNGTAYFFKVAATNSVGTGSYSDASAAATPTVPCAMGGVCIVGNTGPGGGVVFYVHDDADDLFTSIGSGCNTTCKYLEAAPTTGPNAWTVVPRTWATDTDPDGYLGPEGWGGNLYTSVTGANGTAIGTGYQNSLDISRQLGNVAATSAAIEARAYQGNSKNDWYLPSKDELSWLSASREKVGFVENYYWSSSQMRFDKAFSQQFKKNVVLPQGTGKVGSMYVHPVRAFG